MPTNLPVSNRLGVQKYIDSHGVCVCVEHLPAYLQPQTAADLLRTRLADYVAVPLHDSQSMTCEVCAFQSSPSYRRGFADGLKDRADGLTNDSQGSAYRLSSGTLAEVQDYHAGYHAANTVVGGAR